MHIRQVRIVNLSRYLSQLSGSNFQVICDLAEVSESRRARAGVPTEIADGDTFLPAMIGAVSRFNAEGRSIVRRDLPKESRYIRTVYWQWETWNGDQHSDFKDIYRECYPRDPVPPPAIELTIRIDGSRQIVSSSILTNSPECREENKHIFNLFLELFGVCDVLEEGRTLLAAPQVRHLNWRFLPAGRYPWDKLEEYLLKVLPVQSAGTHILIRDRQETIKQFGPIELYVGEGGFSDYIAYVFESPKIVIFESIRRDNALYVFGDDWRACSRLTKADVINNNLYLHRIVHSQGWKAKLAEVVAQHPS